MKIFVVSGIPNAYDETITIKAFTKKANATKFKKKEEHIYKLVRQLEYEIRQFEYAIKYKKDHLTEYIKNNPIKWQVYSKGQINLRSFIECLDYKKEIKNCFYCYNQGVGLKEHYNTIKIEEIELD